MFFSKPNIDFDGMTNRARHTEKVLGNLFIIQ